MLFFSRFKAGRYGRFYGNVDPMVITSALVIFRRERAEVIARHEDEDREKERERQASEAISYEEYMKRKSREILRLSR